MKEIQIEHNIPDGELVDTLEKSAKAIRSEVTKYKPFPDKAMIDLESFGNDCFHSIVNGMMDDIADIINTEVGDV